jgi:cytoskeletal protein CcmA (bactofilin family)
MGFPSGDHPMPDNEPTVLGPECSLKGDLRLNGPCRILGSFEGAIRGATEIHIGQGGVCIASLEADLVTIEGSHTGDIIARRRLQLGPKAQVRGDVLAGALSIADGAVFAGQVAIGPEAVATSRSQREDVPVTEVKIVAGKSPLKVEWAGDASPPDWLNQPIKPPAWARDLAGAD